MLLRLVSLSIRAEARKIDHLSSRKSVTLSPTLPLLTSAQACLHSTRTINLWVSHTAPGPSTLGCPTRHRNKRSVESQVHSCKEPHRESSFSSRQRAIYPQLTARSSSAQPKAIGGVFMARQHSKVRGRPSLHSATQRIFSCSVSQIFRPTNQKPALVSLWLVNLGGPNDPRFEELADSRWASRSPPTTKGSTLPLVCPEVELGLSTEPCGSGSPAELSRDRALLQEIS